MPRAERSSGVTAAAIVVFVGSAFTVLMALTVALTFPVISRMPPSTSAPAPPIGMRAIMFPAGAFYLGLAAWGIVTGVGLLKLKAWARASILVFSVLMIVTFGMGAVSLLFISKLMPAMPGGRASLTILGIVTATMAIPVLIAVWWLVLFNLKSVRAQFDEYPTTGQYAQMDGSARTLFLQPHPPLSIVLIGWMYLLAVPGLVTVLFIDCPVMLLGMLVRGPVAKAIFLLYLPVTLYVGIGLLKLKPPARIVAIVLSVLHMLNSALFVMLPGLEDRMKELLDSTGAALPPQLTANMLVPLARMGLIVGLGLSVAVLWILVTRKSAFTASAATEP